MLMMWEFTFRRSVLKQKNTEWLTVPWSQVGEIKKELFFNRNKWPPIELMLSDIEINIFSVTLN